MVLITESSSGTLQRRESAVFFATDSLITTLMCAPRSVYSWDIIVERRGDFLFFDKRDGSNLNLLTGLSFPLTLLRQQLLQLDKPTYSSCLSPLLGLAKVSVLVNWVFKVL